MKLTGRVVAAGFWAAAILSSSAAQGVVAIDRVLPVVKVAPVAIAQPATARDESVLETWALVAGGLGLLAFIVRRRFDE